MNIYGMYAGVAIGDALGQPFEFSANMDEYDGLNGKITDDTWMTMTLVNIIRGGYTRERAISSYIIFGNNCKQIGKNTKALFGTIKTLKGYEGKFAKIDRENTQGNGCLMRASALVETNYNNAIIDCELTNPNNISVSCVIIYVYMLKRILKGTFSKKGTKKFIKNNTWLDESVVEVFHNALENDDLDVTVNKGWVVNAFHLAVYTAFHKFKSFQDGIDFVIMHGGDTDTNGAICGAILGAKFGLDTMLSETKTKHNFKRILKTEYPVLETFANWWNRL